MNSSTRREVAGRSPHLDLCHSNNCIAIQSVRAVTLAARARIDRRRCARRAQFEFAGDKGSRV
jgi:hypothetical protein